LWQDACYSNTHNLDEKVTSHQKRKRNLSCRKFACVSSTLRDITTLWFRLRGCCPPLQQSIARWLRFRKYSVK
jgi:hypothetical protein